MLSLTIRLLGAFQIWRDDDLITAEEWPTQKTKMLLKILLTERRHVVPSDRLIDLLWPDLTLDSAANSLHVATSQLRRILEPELERPADSNFVLTRAGGYLFHVSSDCWIDVDAFWESMTRGEQWAQQSEWGPAIAAFRTAKELYHGDYLEEDLYEEWAIAPREKLREAYLESLSRLAACCARLGEHHQAVATCEKVLAEDPVHEGVSRQVMAYHYRLGQRARALRAFERCRDALAETLGVDPMPQTRDLHRRILQEKPVDEPVQFRTQPTPPQAQRPVLPAKLPLVGRDGELQALRDHLAEAMDGRGRMVFITGEAGIGKTRLAKACLALARERSVQVWCGKCHEVERDLPFQPVREALRPYLLRHLAPEQAQRVLGPWAPQVALLLPEVKELAPDIQVPEPLPPQQARQRLLHGLVQFCLLLATRYPLVMFLDDLQWADPSTLQFLHLFVRHIEEEQVLILGAFRSEEVDADHPLTAVDQSLVLEGLAAKLELGRLSAGAVTALIKQKAASGWDSDAFSRRLYAETEGNPLLLSELLQSLLEESLLVEDVSGRWQPAARVNLADVALRLPETVQRVIESRIGAASDVAQQVLGAAAVIGQRFDYQLLERASEVGTAKLLDALDELLARRLLREPGEAENGEYAFGHDKIRDVVYEGLSRARCRHLHRKTAAALEAVYAGRTEAIAGRLARHYAEAGLDDKTLHYLILAGDRAARQDANPEGGALQPGSGHRRPYAHA